jgi:4-amino-4-deoxy-L-arabinose transferase-like glycosyltransferase
MGYEVIFVKWMNMVPVTKKRLRFPVAIFLVALCLRLIPVLALRTLGIGLDDMFQYDMLARSLASGDGYRWYAQEDLPLITSYIHLDVDPATYDPRGVLTSFRPPLYPAFLALIYAIAGMGGGRFFVARLVQTILGASLAPLAYALGRRLFPDEVRIATIASWGVALYPMLVIYPLSLATENLFFVLMLSSILALVIAWQTLTDSVPGSPRSRIGVLFQDRWFILTGILFGLMALTRSVSLALVGVAVLWIWFVARARRQAIVLAAVVAALTLPWMLRNTFLHQHLTGIESALGYDLYVGYHPQGTGTFQYPQSLDLMTMIDDGERDELGREKAWEFISADPWRFPYLILRRAGYFFGLERRAMTYFYSNNFFGYIPQPVLFLLSGVLCVPFVLISLSSVPGMLFVERKREKILVLVLLACYMVPHLLIIAEDRFHLALVPFLALFAASFWVEGRTRMGEAIDARHRYWLLGIALVLVSLLLATWGLELSRDADKLRLLFGPSGNLTYFPY